MRSTSRDPRSVRLRFFRGATRWRRDNDKVEEKLVDEVEKRLCRRGTEVVGRDKAEQF